MMLQYSPPSEIIQKAFPGISNKEAEELVNSGETHSYPSKYVLCQEGAFEDIFYLVLNGEVRVTKLINDTEVRVLTTLVTGDFFGEMALIHNAPRAATVKTISPTTVLEISKTDFEKLLSQHTSVSLAMVREVSRRLRENDEMAIEDLRIKAKELAEAYQQLAEYDYTRQEFLTTIAHQLRTPLTASYGYLQSMRMGIIKEDDLESSLARVLGNLEQIITLVNDILFLQEIELILLEFKPIDLGDVVTSTVEKEKENADANGISLNLTIAPDLPDVMADEGSIERVVKILLDNAIKFSPDGGDVNIEVDHHNDQILVSVHDHGVGIPPEAMPRLFRRFFRLDEVDGYLFTGAGLGLSIAQQVVEQHGGEIEVESELGKGSSFTIRLNTEIKGS